MITLKTVMYAAVVTLAAFVLFIAYQTQAGPPTFLRTAHTANATTSVVYMTPGTATTSLTYDAYALNGTAEVYGSKSFELGVQFTGSSTASTICRTLLVSNDGVDFYNFSATSTIGAGNSSHCYTFSSTTQQLGGGTTAIDLKYFEIPVVARYTKVLLYIPLGSLNGALWAEVIGIKSRF